MFELVLMKIAVIGCMVFLSTVVIGIVFDFDPYGKIRIFLIIGTLLTLMPMFVAMLIFVFTGVVL